jgi:cold shock CspA family protein
MSDLLEPTTTNETSNPPLLLIGQVKWFNNKAGYGFITVNDGEYSGKDIFIHYSTIRITNAQYKYLVQGEYVEFTLEKSVNGKHEFQATAVSGIKGGKLMCETRQASRSMPSERPSTSYRRFPGSTRTENPPDDGFAPVKNRRRPVPPSITH